MTKHEFLKRLDTIPCEEGLEAFLAHKGSIQDYFINHLRGAKAACWCVMRGGNVPEIFTPEVCLEIVKEYVHAIEYLTAEQRTPEIYRAAAQ